MPPEAAAHWPFYSCGAPQTRQTPPPQAQSPAHLAHGAGEAAGLVPHAVRQSVQRPGDDLLDACAALGGAKAQRHLGAEHDDGVHHRGRLLQAGGVQLHRQRERQQGLAGEGGEARLGAQGHRRICQQQPGHGGACLLRTHQFLRTAAMRKPRAGAGARTAASGRPPTPPSHVESRDRSLELHLKRHPGESGTRSTAFLGSRDTRWAPAEWRSTCRSSLIPVQHSR